MSGTVEDVVGTVQSPLPLFVAVIPFDQVPTIVSESPEKLTVTVPLGPIEPEGPWGDVNVMPIGSEFTTLQVPGETQFTVV